jgi:hypothetical protein
MRLAYVFWASLVLAAAGVWQIFMPYVSGFGHSWTFGYWNDVVCGAIIVVLAIWSALWRRVHVSLWRAIGQAGPTIGIVGVAVYQIVVTFDLYYQQLGRFQAFYELATATFVLVVGLTVLHSRFAHVSMERAESHNKSLLDQGRARGAI